MTAPLPALPAPVQELVDAARELLDAAPDTTCERACARLETALVAFAPDPFGCMEFRQLLSGVWDGQPGSWEALQRYCRKVLHDDRARLRAEWEAQHQCFPGDKPANGTPAPALCGAEDPEQFEAI